MDRSVHHSRNPGGALAVVGPGGEVSLAARLVSACLLAAALHQGVNPSFPAKPDYWSFVNIWDARWYGEVLQNGYPEVLPTDGAGTCRKTPGRSALFPCSAGWSGVTGMQPASP